jgi:hypothetical protein
MKSGGAIPRMPVIPTRRVLLPEDDVPLGRVERPPGADAPFQSPPDTNRFGGCSRAVLKVKYHL